MIVLRPAAGVRGRNDELAFSPDGAQLASGRVGRRVLIWNDRTSGARAELIKLPDGGGETRVAFTPSGDLFAGNDGLFLLDRLGRLAVKFRLRHWDTLWFGVSPTSSLLVLAQKLRERATSRLTGWAEGRYRKPVWEATTRGQVWSPPLFLPGGESFVWIEYRRDPDRGWLSYRVTRSCANGAELSLSPPLAEVPDRAALSPDGTRLACCARDRLDIYPAVGSWTQPTTIKNDNKKHFTGIAFHPSGRYLAATSNDETVKLYDTTTWEVARTFTWDLGPMRSIAFSPDGALAAAGSDTGKVVVWDVDL